MNTSTKLKTWNSMGKTISAHNEIKDLFTVVHEDGSHHSVTSSHELMQEKYPINAAKQKR